MNDYISITNIFNFLVMREAHEMGMVTDDTWKDFLEMLIQPMADSYRKEHTKEADNGHADC